MNDQPAATTAAQARNGRPTALESAFAWAGGVIFAASLAFFLYAYLVRFGRPGQAGPTVLPAAVNVALFSAFALHHSLLARTRAKALVRTRLPPVLERAVYTWTASVLFLGVCWLWRPLPGTVYQLTGIWWWAGVAAQAAGVLLTHRGSAAIDMLDLAGIRQVLIARRGSARDHVPLETRGVYGWVRHPLYLGWALLVFGAPHMTATRLLFAAVSTGYLALAIPWEERSLVEVFGAEYEAYRRKVRWRMVPGVY